MLLQWDLSDKSLHEKYVALADDEFEENFKRVVLNIHAFKKIKVLTISGPSSAGKTTTAMKLASDLKLYGVTAKIISMDDFYRNTDNAPRKPDGSPDYETLDALDTDLLIDCLKGVAHGNTVNIPRFNFKTGKREDQMRELSLAENEIVIMEGIHGLNPRVLMIAAFCSSVYE
ncbi:hypothetical protein FACS1894219_07460 [Clostridia bacterium]|nr:hypothetical protein FACS1894219_07460 [Clostridia bacterium]